MASITRRGNRWLAQVRRKGSPFQSRTFDNRADAKSWAAAEEARIDRAEAITPRRVLAGTIFRDLIDRYRLEISPSKKSAATEQHKLNALRRDPLALVPLNKLDGQRVADFRDRRLRSVKAATVRRELALISHVLEVARKEWGFRLPHNPVRDIRQPPIPPARDRRLNTGEFERLMQALTKARNRELGAAVRLAIETGLRRGELVGLRWENIDLGLRLAHIPETKTGKPRTIPLTPRATAILETRRCERGAVFCLSLNALKLGWRRLTKRAAIDGLTFHDLRHEAISRFFELGLSLPEVALISGHRDPRMLFRYTHLRPIELARKIGRLTGSTKQASCGLQLVPRTAQAA